MKDIWLGSVQVTSKVLLTAVLSAFENFKNCLSVLEVFAGVAFGVVNWDQLGILVRVNSCTPVIWYVDVFHSKFHLTHRPIMCLKRLLTLPSDIFSHIISFSSSDVQIKTFYLLGYDAVWPVHKSESVDLPMTFYQTHPSFDKKKRKKEREPHILVHVLKSRFIRNKRKLNVIESFSSCLCITEERTN